MNHYPSQQACRNAPIDDLERRQDEVLEKLDELDAAISLLLDEFNIRLAGATVGGNDQVGK